MALDVWKEVSGVESASDCYANDDPRDHLCSWDVLTLRDGTLYLLIHCCQHRVFFYHIAPTEVAADTSIRFEAYYTV
ncbi:hypothetical protein TNCV_2849881 [Trichonephila clavipes]|nr:hypothetical protein TNCV_2849881 [Trichonephila clavipes]